MPGKHQYFALLLKVINYFAFYIIWVGCLYAALHQLSFLFFLIVCAYLVLHLTFVSERSLAELFLIASIMLIGTANDILLTELHVVQYTDALPIGVSWWMLGIWACFGSTYWHAFSWLESRLTLSVLLGALVVPFCYLWGIEAKTVTFLWDESSALVLIGILWAIVLPITFIISHAIKRHAV